MRHLPKSALILLLASLVTLSVRSARADDEAPAKELPGQIGDSPAQPFEPATPRDEDDENRVEAMAWFMKGRIQQSRNQFNEALESYAKALDLDPEAIDVYRAYVPLAFTLRKTEDAIKRALVLVELDPDNPELMQQLGRDMARRGRLAEAIQLLEKASEAPSLKKRSASFVSLNRDLSVLYSAAGIEDKLADAYAVVFEALVNPDKYELDMAVHAALENDRAVNYERMGEAFLAAKRIEKAANAFSIAAERAGGKVGTVNYNLARMHLQAGDHRRALAELQKYLDAKLRSKGKAPYELLADILEKLEKSDELIERLEKLAEKDGRNNLLLSYLGDRYIDAKKLDEARKTFVQITEDNRDALGHAGLARVNRLEGKTGSLLDSLVKCFEGGLAAEVQVELEAIAEDEKTLDALVAEGLERTKGDKPTLDFVGSLILAGLAGEADRSDDTIAFHRYALRKAKPRQKPAVYGDLGDELIDAERYDEAIEVLNKAVNSVTDNAQKAQFLYKLSQAEEMDGNTEAALSTIADARKLMPDNGLLHYQEGWIHYHAKRWDDAIRVFEEIIEQRAGESRIVRAVRFSLSNVYVQKKQMRKAEEVLEAVLEAEPDDPSVNNDLGYLYADQGKNLKKAESMIRKAVTAEPENAAYQDSMGWVLYQLGKYDEALTWLEKAIADPEGADPTLWDHLADCYDKLGRKEDAVKTWKKALDAFDEERPDEDRRKAIRAKLKAAGVELD